MISKPETIDVLLPYGEMLRTFVEQPFISKSDLKAVLRSRGIFVSGSEKEDTIPIAVCCLLSPFEFGQLKECQNTKEDGQKTITRFLNWNSADTLMNAVPSDIDLEALLDENSNYCKMIGNPTFVPVANNPDHLRVDFEIERQDLSKSWATTNSVFKGSLELEKIYDGKNVKVLLKHTASETKQLNLSVSKHLKEHFENTGRIPSAGGETRILFKDFTNEQRVQFFLSLTGYNKTDLLEFKDVIDFDICPDADAGKLPNEIKWMEQKVEELKLKGKNLHETIFIKEAKYHKYLHVHQIDVKFDFSYYAAAGSCTIVFAFAGFMGESGKSAELEINVSNLVLKPEHRDVNKASVKEHISRAIEMFTLEQYRKICPQPRGA